MASVTGLAAGPPQPECISSFGQTVHVFASKQRPIKITIYGNDFRCARSETCVQHRPGTCALHDCRVLAWALLDRERPPRHTEGLDLPSLPKVVNTQTVWLQQLGVRVMSLSSSAEPYICCNKGRALT